MATNFQQPSTYLTPTGFDRQRIMQTAWDLAKHRARRDGTTAKAEFANALSAIWNNARVEAQRAGRVRKVRMVPSFVADMCVKYGTTAYGRAA